MSTRRSPRVGGPRPSPPAQTLPKPNRSTPHDSTDSPYKGLVSELKRVELDKSGSDDFKSPLVKWKAPKVFQKKSTSRKRRNVGNKQQSYIANQENSDVNPDHLQMAVAMSKSCYEAENPNRKGCSTLERFGFSSNKPRLTPEHSRTNMFELPKSRKNSKFRFITPVLMMRAEIDRESLITEKISSILQTTIRSCTHNEVETKYEIVSDNLKEYICKERKTSSVENKTYEDLKTFSFYIAMWDKSFSTESKCGWLLRNWEEIPGREKSPQQVRKVKKNLLRGVSPDLFDSDYESFSPKPQASTSVENVFKSQSGIEHFESFCETPHLPELREDDSSLSKVSESENCDIIDLSQSDGEIEDDCKSPNVENAADNVNAEVSLLEDIQNDFSLNTDDSGSNANHSSQSNSKETEDNVLNCKNPNAENAAMNINTEVEITENCPKDFSLNDSINLSQSKVSQLVNSSIIDLSQSDEEIEDLLNCKSPDVENVTADVNSTKNCPNDFSPNADDSYNLSQSKVSESGNCKIIDISQSDDEIEDTILNCKSPNFENATVNISAEVNSQKDVSLNADDSETTILNIPTEAEISILQKLPSSCNQNNFTDPDQITQDLDLNSSPITQREKDDSSQDSNSDDVIVLSDEELNYSSAHRNPYDLSNDDEEKPMQKLKNLDDEIQDICSNLRKKYCLEKSATGNSACSTSDEETPTSSINHEKKKANLTQLEQCDKIQANPLDSLEFEENLQLQIPEDPCNTQREEEKTIDCANIQTGKTSSTTPKSNVLIKSKNVTPMQDYDRMNTPEIQNNLENFGVKPLKRKRGVQMLKYIYECTHPAIEKCQDDNKIQSRKRIKFESSEKARGVKVIGDDLIKNERSDGLIFERKHSKNIQSCALPLHIAWFNFVQANPDIHRKILTYEPLHLELLYGMLKEQSGCKFNAEDLVTFLDKKCITFRVPQQKRRGQHRPT